MDGHLSVLAPELFEREYLESGRRLDHRGLEERRPITFTRNGLDGCDASSLVGIGRTIVVTRVAATPRPIAPAISIAVSRAAVSSARGAVRLDKALSATIRVLTSRIISLDQLEIVRPDPLNVFQSAIKLWAWQLDVRMAVVSDDGGIEVAALLGFQGALEALALPRFDLDDEAQLVPNGETAPLALRAVAGTRFATAAGALVYDPTRDEEGIVDGCRTVVGDCSETPKLMKIDTTGMFALTPYVVARIVAACVA